jgi:hypothetical protein
MTSFDPRALVSPVAAGTRIAGRLRFRAPASEAVLKLGTASAGTRSVSVRIDSSKCVLGPPGRRWFWPAERHFPVKDADVRKRPGSFLPSARRARRGGSRLNLSRDPPTPACRRSRARPRRPDHFDDRRRYGPAASAGAGRGRASGLPRRIQHRRENPPFQMFVTRLNTLLRSIGR